MPAVDRSRQSVARRASQLIPVHQPSFELGSHERFFEPLLQESTIGAPYGCVLYTG